MPAHSLIGKSLTLNGGSYTVVGILPSALKLPCLLFS